MKFNTKIVAIDYEVAKNVITNDDLTKILDTSDEWIFSRTGIKQRRVASGNENSLTLGVEAAKKALKRAEKNSGFNLESIDLVIAACSAPENIYPSVACLIQGELGLKNAACFDLRAACSGFIYSLNVARAFIKSGTYKNILIVATDTTTKNTDWNDRATCVLFGDGAGAAIISTTDKSDDIIGIDLFSRGDCGDYIQFKVERNTCPLVEKGEDKSIPYIQMKGKDVYKFVMQEVPPRINQLLKDTNTDINEIDYFIPHQSNQRMIEALGQRLGLGEDKVISNISNYGNMSAASILVAIRESVDSGKIKLPAKIIISAFGAGMTGANAIIKLENNI